MSEGHDRRGVDNNHGYRTRSSAGRKDRKRWCRGRVGVEHVVQTMYPPNLPGWVSRRPSALCGPSVHYLWSRQRWTCHHVDMCTACGRIMREYLGNDCPLYDADAVAEMIRAAKAREDAEGPEGVEAGRAGEPVEHWPRTWVVVPVQLEGPKGAATPAVDLTEAVELWFPDGCTCGASTPCRIADGQASGTDTGELTSIGTPT